MPDTKNGIKHLANMASMHQNMYISTRTLFTKQFKSTMRMYTKEINFIKDEQRKLQLDKDKFKKDTDYLKKVMNLNVEEREDDSNMTPREKFEFFKQQQLLENKIVSSKAEAFCKRKVSPSTSISVYDSPVTNPPFGQMITRNKVNQSSAPAHETAPPSTDGLSLNISSRQQKDPTRPPNDAKPPSAERATMSRLDSCSRQRMDTSYGSRNRPKSTSPIASFQNDRYLNSTVNSARAKLLALYTNSVLGPNSKPSPPSILDHRGINTKQRCNTTLGFHETKEQKQKTLLRQTASAEPRIGGERKLRSGNDTDGGMPIVFSGYEQAEMEAEKNHLARQANLERIRQGLLNTSKYENFQKALQRRMLIRDMKAAEYDANHGKLNNSNLTEVLPVKGNLVSAAQQRQSALYAIEKSFLGSMD